MTLDKIGQMVLSPVSLNHAKVWLGSAMAPRNIVRPDQHFPTCARTAAYSRLRLKESHALTYCEAAASPMLRIEVDQCVVFGFPHNPASGLLSPSARGMGDPNGTHLQCGTKCVRPVLSRGRHVSCSVVTSHGGCKSGSSPVPCSLWFGVAWCGCDQQPTHELARANSPANGIAGVPARSILG